MVSSVNKYVSLQAFPIWNGASFLGAVSIFRDVTELHQLNQEVRQMADTYPRIEVLEEKNMAPDSLIREFIGGGIYDD